MTRPPKGEECNIYHHNVDCWVKDFQEKSHLYVGALEQGEQTNEGEREAVN